MNFKRFFFKCIYFLLYCLSVAFFTFIGFCLTLVIFALIKPLHDQYILALIIMIGSIIPALLLTKMIANHFKKKQKCVPNKNTSLSVSEELPNQDPCPVNAAPKVIRREYFSDDLFLDAVDVILESRIVSAGRLQSSLKIGANRAVGLINEMEALGVIGPAKGNLPRDIFFTKDEWNTERIRFVWSPEKSSNPCSSNNDNAFKKEAVKTKLSSNIITYSPVNASNCRCKRCGSSRVSFETLREKRSVGCFTIFLCVFLLFTFLGWFLFFYLLFSHKEETVTYATCQDCGMRWRTS